MSILLLKDLRARKVQLRPGDVIETGGCHNFTCANCSNTTCWGQDSQTWTPLVNFRKDDILESADKRGNFIRAYKGECPHCGQRYAKSARISMRYLALESQTR